MMKLFFALDASVFTEDMTLEEREREMTYLRGELGIMIAGLTKCQSHLPILVLSCHLGSSQQGSIEPEELAEKLGLDDEKWSSRPWAVFKVDISTMKGMARALDWALFHVQKRQNNLAYHTKNGSE